jgi:orotate phosphoribosyltransferase-like protein
MGITTMSGRRTMKESLALRGKVVRLKKEGKSNGEISRELGLTRQYVSFALISTGNRRERPGSEQRLQVNRKNDHAEATISRLENEGEHGLAGMLRVMAKRRMKASERTCKATSKRPR